MGGKAIKNAIRLNAIDYRDVSTRLTNTLRLGNVPHFVIPAYKDKESFGDCDIVYTESNEQFLLNILNHTEVVKNGDVTSIGVKYGDTGVFQVDLIKVPPEDLLFAYHYFSFNDLGNLIGRIAHFAGFKFGHQGLLYMFRDENNPDQMIKEIVVTKNYSEALKFLGYQFRSHFSSLEDIFLYVINNKYFNKNIYLLNNRNAVSRVRDAKRKTYMEFLDYLEELKVDFTILNKHQLRREKLEEALDKFPYFAYQYKVAFMEYEDTKKIKTYFNGERLQLMSGLSGPELGKMINYLKLEIGTRRDQLRFIENDSTMVMLGYKVGNYLRKFHGKFPD